MSTSYSANQYESAFRSQKLQNWTVPKHFKERPSAAEGYTTFIATDRGHLLPGVRTKRGSTWPAFQGTWDLPRQIPPASVNPTARSQEGQDRLRKWGRIKFATNQAHDTPGSNQATNRSSHSVENINVEQSADNSKIPVSDPDQNKPERPKSQNSQAQSNPVSLHENQVQSRSGSHHSQQAPSRPATRESQAELNPPILNSRPASQQK